MISVELLNSSNVDDLNEAYQIWSTGYYGTSLEDFTKAMNNSNVIILVAKDAQSIVGISILSFYLGQQMWSRGERLCDIEYAKITDTSNYEEIAKKLYDMATCISNDRRCIKTTITDFSDEHLFSALDLNYDRCRCEYYLTH